MRRVLFLVRNIINPEGINEGKPVSIVTDEEGYIAFNLIHQSLGGGT
ncbi:hypothetical protein [Photorhabdus temperata]|nr:hypothetical protein [Photorhabdus temperata]